MMVFSDGFWYGAYKNIYVPGPCPKIGRVWYILSAHFQRLILSKLEASVLTFVTEATCSLKSSEESVVFFSNFELITEKLKAAIRTTIPARDQTVVLDIFNT